MSSLAPGFLTGFLHLGSFFFSWHIRAVMQKRKAAPSPNTRPHAAREAYIAIPFWICTWQAINTKSTRIPCSKREERAGTAAFFLP